MNSTGTDVLVQGRIVWVSGSTIFQGQPKTDFNTKQPVIGLDGQPKKQYGFGLAIPKNLINDDPNGVWAKIHTEAYSLYPSGHLPPDFAMKFKDGDGIDHNGQPFANREGYPGCLVFACTTEIPIKFVKHENGANIQISEGIKCGDYICVSLGIKAHIPKGQGKPGMYLNPNFVQLIGYGTEIINAPSGDQIFGTAAPVMPAGASATPIAPAQAPGFPAPQAAAPPQQFQPTPGVQQTAPAAPHYGVLPPAHQPAPGAPAGYPPQAPQAAPVAQPPAMPPQTAPPAFPPAAAPPVGYPPAQPQAAPAPAGYPPQAAGVPPTPPALIPY